MVRVSAMGMDMEVMRVVRATAIINQEETRRDKVQEKISTPSNPATSNVAVVPTTTESVVSSLGHLYPSLDWEHLRHYSASSYSLQILASVDVLSLSVLCCSGRPPVLRHTCPRPRLHPHPHRPSFSVYAVSCRPFHTPHPHPSRPLPSSFDSGSVSSFCSGSCSPPSHSPSTCVVLLYPS